ncbi:MAG TPA: hypothetical protein VFN76_05090 [Candidatus Limnocylindria bacterium]|nr:hypothetical protein [Candidatus Limnocylindria bacterium]
MQLAGYVAVARRWWATLLIATWVAGLAGYLIASGIPPTYEGTTKLLVGPVVGDVDVMRAAGAISYTYAELTTADPALAKVREALALPPDVELVARAIPDETTRILQIRAEYGDPEIAAAIANGLADILMARDAPGVALPEGDLSVVERAVPNPVPIAPRVTLIAIIAAGTGLLAAAVLVLLVEYFGNTVNSREELAAVTSAPLLGFASLGNRFRPTPEVPTIVEGQPDSRAAAAVRFIATKVAYTKPGKPTTSALIVGSATHDGSADLALGIATALARSGQRVLVVDANEEDGELSELVGIDGSPGLAELLDNPSLDVQKLANSRQRGPSTLSRGTTSRVDLIDPAAARAALAKLTQSFDLVVIAGAPIHLSGSALVWAGSVESVVLSVERDRAKRDDVAYASDNLLAADVSLLGTVLLGHAPRPRRRRSRRNDTVAQAVLTGGPSAATGGTPPQRPSARESASARRSDGLGR